MATQITHIATADKLFSSYFSRFDRKEFYIGTVFPDIRYPAKIDRDETHLYDVTLQDVLNETNSFRAGVMFHCLLDLVREAFVDGQGMYELFPDSEDRFSIPKFLEDELLYHKVSDWPVISSFFNAPLAEELAYPVSAVQVKLWHQGLQRYFHQAPTDQSRVEYVVSLGFPAERATTLNEAVGRLRNNRRAIEIMTAFYNQLETLVRP